MCNPLLLIILKEFEQLNLDKAIATLGIPGSIAIVLLIIFAVLQLIGEFVEACGKVAPAALKVRKIITRSIHKKKEAAKETAETLIEVKNLLTEVNKHYSADNIAQRDDWISWVNNRAEVYDAKVKELSQLKDVLDQLVINLAENSKTTDDLYKESCRTTIINFSHVAGNPLNIISEEEFKRVQKVYEDYESFLTARNEPNGQVETCYSVIQDAYKERLKTNNFLEHMRDKH